MLRSAWLLPFLVALIGNGVAGCSGGGGPRDIGGGGGVGVGPGGGAGSTAINPCPSCAGASGAAGSLGVAGNAAGTGGAGGAGGTQAEVVGPGTVTAEPVDDASYLFDQTQLRTYDIKLAAADLATLNQNPAAEQYVMGSLLFEGTTIEQVAVRYKGSVGAFLRPCTNSTFGEAAGPKVGKCSIKLSFNEVDPEGQFHGLRKLNFHSMNQDASMMRDRLGYAMFRQFGVPAPRAVHARVLINGQLEGLFVVVEQVDGRFTRSRFTEGGKGNLYKEIWPMHTDASAYTNALETNEDQMPSVQRMLDFHTAIGQGSAGVEQWIDRQATLDYIAADRVMINDDGAFHWWCTPKGQGNNPGGVGNHNYYWYEAEKVDRFWIIPWDMDNSLAGGGGIVQIQPEWTAAGSCICGGLAQQLAPSCDPLIHVWGEWSTDYEAAVDRFLAGPFAASNVDALLGAWQTQISGAVSEASGKNGAPTTMAWQSAFSSLKTAIQSMRTNRGYAYP